MNAEQIFKELGYKKSTDIDAIAYSEKLDGTFYHFEITFDLLEKEIVIGTNMEYVIENDLLQAIIQQAKELGWLEDEKQEIKQETNIEHYYEYLSEVGLGGFALVNGRCTKCSGTRCSECDFSSSDCCNKRLRWLASPYRKKYKLTKFEFDLLNTYKDSGMRKSIFNYSTLLGLQEKGYFKDINTSIPIYEILDNCEVI